MMLGCAGARKINLYFLSLGEIMMLCKARELREDASMQLENGCILRIYGTHMDKQRGQ